MPPKCLVNDRYRLAGLFVRIRHDAIVVFTQAQTQKTGMTVTVQIDRYRAHRPLKIRLQYVHE